LPVRGEYLKLKDVGLLSDVRPCHAMYPEAATLLAFQSPTVSPLCSPLLSTNAGWCGATYTPSRIQPCPFSACISRPDPTATSGSGPTPCPLLRAKGTGMVTFPCASLGLRH
jgi:hypothetical protein